MAQAPVVADASALICLGWVDQLQLLPALFGRIIVPPAVVAEATHRGPALPDWIDVRPLGRPIDARVSAAHLGPGESEVLSLGFELKDAWLILDDGDARALAHELRLHVLGTAAVILEGKRAGFLPLVRPTLDALLARGFRLERNVAPVRLGEHLDRQVGRPLEVGFGNPPATGPIRGVTSAISRELDGAAWRSHSCGRERRHGSRMSVPTDTDPESARVQMELLRAAGPVRRANLALELTRTVIALSRRALRGAHPAMPEAELEACWVELHYGRELAEGLRAYRQKTQAL